MKYSIPVWVSAFALAIRATSAEPIMRGTHQDVLPPPSCEHDQSVSPFAVSWYFNAYADSACTSGSAQCHAAGPGNKACTACSMSTAYIQFNGHTADKALCLFSDTACTVSKIEHTEVLDRTCLQVKGFKSYKVVDEDDVDSCLPDLPNPDDPDVDPDL